MTTDGLFPTPETPAALATDPERDQTAIVFLTDRPVRIRPQHWPIVQERQTDQTPRPYHLVVRQHADGRRLVTVHVDQPDGPFRYGEVVGPEQMLNSALWMLFRLAWHDVVPLWVAQEAALDLLGPDDL